MKDNFSQEKGEWGIRSLPPYDFVTIALSFPAFFASEDGDESDFYTQENICQSAQPATFDGFKFVLANRAGEKFMLTLEPRTRRAEDVLQEEQALLLFGQASALPAQLEKAVTGKPYLFKHNRLWTLRKFVAADKQFNWRLPTWGREHCRVGGALLAQLHCAKMGAFSKDELRLLRPPAQWKDVCLARLEQLFALAGEFELDKDLNFSVESALIITGRITEKLCEIKELEMMVEQWFKNKASSRSWKTVIHGDFHPGNLLFAGLTVQKIIDWDYARLDDPLFDFAYARLMFAGNFREGDFSCGALFDQEKVQAFDDAYRGALALRAEKSEKGHEWGGGKKAASEFAAGKRENENDDKENDKEEEQQQNDLWLAVLLSLCPESGIRAKTEMLVKDLLYAYYDLVLALILTFEIEQALYFKAQADIAARNAALDGMELAQGTNYEHNYEQAHSTFDEEQQGNISANRRIMANILAYFRRG